MCRQAPETPFIFIQRWNWLLFPLAVVIDIVLFVSSISLSLSRCDCVRCVSLRISPDQFSISARPVCVLLSIVCTEANKQTNKQTQHDWLESSCWCLLWPMSGMSATAIPQPPHRTVCEPVKWMGKRQSALVSLALPFAIEMWMLIFWLEIGYWCDFNLGYDQNWSSDWLIGNERVFCVQ